MAANPSIVVGVDGSPASDRAVRWAAEAAQLHHAPLVLVSAWTVSMAAYGGIGMPQWFFDDQVAEARRKLEAAEQLVRSVAGEPVSLDKQLVAGAPAEALVELSIGARMVVVGARGLGELTSGLVGSVSSAVSHHAECPVVILHDTDVAPAVTGEGEGDGEGEGAVVVGVDGSAASEPALAIAFEEASLRGAELVAVHAWSDQSLRPATPDRGLPWESIESAEKAALAESLAGFTDRYPDVVVQRVVVQDRPVRHLLACSEGAQLLVVGSRGRGGFRGLLLGSTSTALLHSAECPLMIVRNRR
ncbi:universal stress protein [Rhodococcus sp. X156]|uniref:universal stress protein n=1 Tax=Rhodococcus sp. X156 TaxID=2499145 RepID=UPI000FD6F1D3|nr:universal stress protein [Rhodococcus sp. X156]